MKVAILGTRGIPNYYGGFEQCAEYLSVGLVREGHEVFVYNSHNHPYQKNKYNDVHIIHCFDPENNIGTFGQFIYDLNCILDSRKRNFDVIIQLGYTSSSIWNFLFNSKVKVITNMDGLEWKRSKYAKPTQLFLKYAESLAIKYADVLVADSKGIKQYLKEKYSKESSYIAYGASILDKTPNTSFIEELNLEKYQYDLVVARIEPENNIEEIIKGFCLSSVNRKLVVVGSTTTTLGKKLKNSISDNRVRFLEYIKGIDKLDELRYYSNLYFHGHTVGGTNPSLLEAMSSKALICAHKNIFNESILDKNAHYFSTISEITKIVDSVVKSDYHHFLNQNTIKINKNYSWDTIIKKYSSLL